MSPIAMTVLLQASQSASVLVASFAIYDPACHALVWTRRSVVQEKKLMRTMKFPKEYELKVNFKLVNWEIMKVQSLRFLTLQRHPIHS